MSDPTPDTIEWHKVIEQNTAALTAATRAVESVGPMFSKESRRRGWAIVALVVAVVILIGAVVLLARDNASYRQRRCESANDSRFAIRTGIGRVFVVLAPHPTEAQQAKIDAVNADLAKALPSQKC